MTTLRQRWTSWWRRPVVAEPERSPADAEIARLRAEIGRLRAEITGLNGRIVLLTAQRNAESARADALLAGARQFQAELDQAR